MKLTVLVDNNTYIDRYFLGEPGLSYYIEDEDEKLLFDTGYSDVYLRNAKKMNIDLSAISALVLSHGHNDHTRGLLYFPPGEKKITLVAHPDIFEKKRSCGKDIGCPLTEEAAAQRFDLRLSRLPVKVTKNITFLGEIRRVTSFENKIPVGEHLKDGRFEGDFLADDSALVYEDPEGICVITGCSHSGICNIMEQAKRITGKTRVKGLIGGLHLSGRSGSVIKTADYLAGQHIPLLFPCHCTSFESRCVIGDRAEIREVGVGLSQEF